jgi:hypothetical protein
MMKVTKFLANYCNYTLTIYWYLLYLYTYFKLLRKQLQYCFYTPSLA